ncbi:MAG: bifunctional phosphopantothenoylcysteine decarboxylase/phosphopantothenate--cysteine ligase CoaBC [Pseudomonadota bacterium]
MRVLLGISGGIAAYKTPDLVRRLGERGADVQVVLSENAARFVSPLSLQAVSGRPVRDSLWDEAAEAAMGHIELARWAERILIAPASAGTMAKLAHGAAPDLLTTLCLASSAPLTLAPAMNRQMWAHPATQANRALLAERDVAFLGPAAGDQACGEIGTGRMLEPAEIAEALLAEPLPGLAGRTVLITAGPTREPLDPVRYLTNRSSGRMGYALAQAFREAGAAVRLVSGPVALPQPTGVEISYVETAVEMRDTVLGQLDGVDLFVGAAAIADYSPAEFSPAKIKKSADEVQLPMVKTPDTLATVAAMRGGPFTVGFAAETNDIERYARAKLERKQLDMIVANRVGPDCGFDRPDNAATVIWQDGRQPLPSQPKIELARALVRLIDERFGDARRRSNVTSLKDTVA